MTATTSGVVLARSGEPVDGAATERPCFRIPALAVLPSGRIVAAWDVRPDWRDLPGPIGLVMRTSDDGGRTWSPTRVLRGHERRGDGGVRGFGDASLLVSGAGKLLCWYVSSDGESFFSARPGGPGLGLWLSSSDDGGETWTHRSMDQLRPDWVGGMFAASGNGIRLARGAHAGRLLQPFVVRDGAGERYAVAAWSDDDGENWTLGERVGPDCDENKLVELADGTVLMHARATPRRRQALSADGGRTFTESVPHPSLVEPACNGGACRWGGLLVASLPDDERQRRRLGLRWSADEGRTWSDPVLVDAGAAAYSVVAELADGALGLLYEAGDYEELIFRRIGPGDLGEHGGEVRLDARAQSAATAAKPPEVAVPRPN